MRAPDAVQRRVAHVDVGAGHVDLRAQHLGAVQVGTVAHRAQLAQVLFRRAAAERAVRAGRGEVAAVGAHLLGRLLVDVGAAVGHQRLGGAVHEVEVVAGVVEVVAERRLPVEAEPAHVLLDAVDVFLLFLFRIGVVEAQVAHAAVVARQAEVQADALGVAHVQVAVGLGREAQAHARRVGHARRVFCRIARTAAPLSIRVRARLEVALDHVAQEIGGLDGVFGRRGSGGCLGRVHVWRDSSWLGFPRCRARSSRPPLKRDG